jgi:xanthine dehydrogenase accessory factor
VFCTQFGVGDLVEAGQRIARIADVPIHAPMAGPLRGLSHDGAIVDVGTQVVEIDHRRDFAQIFGLGERPSQIAQGVLAALQTHG